MTGNVKRDAETLLVVRNWQAAAEEFAVGGQHSVWPAVPRGWKQDEGGLTVHQF